MKDRIFSANDRLLFTNDRIRLGSVTFSHNRILYMFPDFSKHSKPIISTMISQEVTI